MDDEAAAMPSPSRRGMLHLALVVEGGIALLALGLAWVFGLPVVEHIRGSPAGWIAGFLAAAPMLLSLWWCRKSRAGPVRNFGKLIDDMVAPLFRNCRVVDLLLISVLAGVGEELFFRGLLQHGLMDWLSPLLGRTAAVVIAVSLASVVFGLAHFVSIGYAVFAAIVGAFLGVLFLATDDLVAPMVAHAVYDFVALWFLARRSA